MKGSQKIEKKIIEREPFTLPFVCEPPNVREVLVKIFSASICRKVDVHEVESVLFDFYEQAYSNGLKDMDKMHKMI